MNLFDNYFLSRIELREEKSHHRPFILKIYIFSIIEEKRKQEKKKKKNILPYIVGKVVQIISPFHVQTSHGEVKQGTFVCLKWVTGSLDVDSNVINQFVL